MTANTLFSLQKGESPIPLNTKPVLNTPHSNGNPKKIIPVVGLVLLCPESDRVALFQRAPGQSGSGEWEFPGGKIEEGESFAEALSRECQEELGLSLKLSEVQYCGTVAHDYPQKTVQIWFFKYEYSSSQSQQFVLVDHDEMCWVTSQQLADFALSAADQKFIESRIRT